MDGVLCDFYGPIKKALIDNPKIAYPQSVYGFFTKLPPRKYAIESFKWLSENFDTWILTRPSVMNPLCYTEKRVWVEEHLGFDACKKLIITPDKGLMKGDYLIDDNLWDQFEGENIHFGSDKFPDWISVINYFKFHLDIKPIN